MTDNHSKSLLSLFVPPDGLHGIMGIMCGLSAESDSMEDIMSRFSERNSSQRAMDGHHYLSLLVDRHSPMPSTVRGCNCIWHKPEHYWNKVKYMHAKVALLAFGKATHQDISKVPLDDLHIRLIVFTGNWTREAVNNSLNLVWYCDYKKGEHAYARDIRSAAEFFMSLDNYYYLDKDKTAGRFLNKIQNIRGSEACHFIWSYKGHSIKKSFFNSIPQNCRGRNLLVVGSGFFEQGKNSDGDIPSVIEDINQKLRFADDGKIYRHLVINSNTCGNAVTEWLQQLDPQKKDGWKVHTAIRDKLEIALHAKYIFLGKMNSDKLITQGSLYIGSGNISKQGFQLSPGSNGNIEAGVVLNHGIGLPVKEKDLLRMLGINERPFDCDSIEVPKEQETEMEPVSQPPPIVSFTYNNGRLEFEPMDRRDVLIDGGMVAISGMKWAVPQDFSGFITVALKNDPAQKWEIPVFLPDGNFYPQKNRAYAPDPEDILNELESFPGIDDAESDENASEGDDSQSVETPSSAGGIPEEYRSEFRKYPLHFATTLLETIADRNQHVTPENMPDWAALLRRNLTRDSVIKQDNEYRRILSPYLKLLKRTDGFCPPFKRRKHAREKYAFELYLQAIDDIKACWDKEVPHT